MTLVNIKALFLILGMFALLAGPANVSQSRSVNEVNLHRVKKIFLETQKNDDMSEQGIAAFSGLHSVLKEALLSFGFTVVDNSADADAVMYGGNTIGWVVLDGPPMDPPKYGFQFWLTSSKYNVKWQTEFNISSRANASEVDRKAIQKAARNLFNSWKKSAKNAGIVVGDKLP
jgi:hypothetical protein